MDNPRKPLGPIGLVLRAFRENRFDPGLVLASIGGLIGLVMFLCLGAWIIKMWLAS